MTSASTRALLKPRASEQIRRPKQSALSLRNADLVRRECVDSRSERLRYFYGLQFVLRAL
jgi:hypothetical protein